MAYQFSFVTLPVIHPNSRRMQSIIYSTVSHWVGTRFPLSSFDYSPGAESQSKKGKWYTNASAHSQHLLAITFWTVGRRGRRGHDCGRRRSNSTRNSAAGLTTDDRSGLEFVVFNREKGRVEGSACIADRSSPAPELCWSFVSSTWAGPDIGPFVGWNQITISFSILIRFFLLPQLELMTTYELYHCKTRDRSHYRTSLQHRHSGKRVQHHQSRDCFRGIPLSQGSRRSVQRWDCRGCDHLNQTHRASDSRRMSGIQIRRSGKGRGGGKRRKILFAMTAVEPSGEQA